MSDSVSEIACSNVLLFNTGPSFLGCGVLRAVPCRLFGVLFSDLCPA
jgi:hypothetical protein